MAAGLGQRQCRRRRQQQQWHYPFYCCLLFLLHNALVTVRASSNGTTVQFDYRILVNFTSAISSIESAVSSVEGETKAFLQNQITTLTGVSGDSTEITFASTVGDSCSSSTSDACNLVSTACSVSGNYAGFVAVASASSQFRDAWVSDINQAFFNEISVSFNTTTDTPSSDTRRTSLVIRLSNVANRLMNDAEIAIFEDSLFATLEDTLSSSSLSASIQKVEVISQQLVPTGTTPTSRLRRLQDSSSYDNLVNTTITGACNGCSQQDLNNLYDDAVDNPKFEKELKRNGQSSNASGTDYFDTVTNTSTSTISPIQAAPTQTNNNGGSGTNQGNGASSTSSSKSSSASPPVWLWFVLGGCVGLVFVAVLVLLCVRSRKKRREKELEDEEKEAALVRRQRRRQKQIEERQNRARARKTRDMTESDVEEDEEEQPREPRTKPPSRDVVEPEDENVQDSSHGPRKSRHAVERQFDGEDAQELHGKQRKSRNTVVERRVNGEDVRETHGKVRKSQHTDLVKEPLQKPRRSSHHKSRQPPREPRKSHDDLPNRETENSSEEDICHF